MSNIKNIREFKKIPKSSMRREMFLGTYLKACKQFEKEVGKLKKKFEKASYEEYNRRQGEDSSLTLECVSK